MGGVGREVSTPPPQKKIKKIKRNEEVKMQFLLRSIPLQKKPSMGEGEGGGWDTLILRQHITKYPVLTKVVFWYCVSKENLPASFKITTDNKQNNTTTYLIPDMLPSEEESYHPHHKHWPVTLHVNKLL